ncbi:MAG TPA: hypothetical protein VIJ07_06735 [Dermatophilaceae bacterium]
MARFHVSQGERWHRNYQIEADSPEGALATYKRRRADPNDSALDVDDALDPEYLEDIEDDIEVSPA